MKPRQLPWKRLLLLIVALALAAICLVPWWIGDTSRFGQRVASALQHWTGGEVRLTGRVQIRYFPDIAIRSGIEIKDSRRLPMAVSISCKKSKISLSLANLLLGRVRIEAIKLTQPKIVIAGINEPPNHRLQMTETALLRALRDRPLNVLQVQDGELTIGDLQDSVEHLSLQIDAGRDADLASASGSLQWRGEPVQFSLDMGIDAAALADVGDDTQLPLALTINSAPLTAAIKAQASFTPQLQLNGTMDAHIADLRHLLSWMEVADLQGPGLKDLSASGPFHSSGRSLTFDQGHFSMDGNDATGLLMLSLGPKRPRVEATLAFDALDLDPYLPKATATASDTAVPSGPVPPRAVASLPAGERPIFDWPLVQRVDADLRLSAGSVAIAGQQLGGGAFTIAANQGVVIGEIGEIEFCGGSASGRLSLDLSAPIRQVDLTGSLDGVDMQPCLQMLQSKFPVSGQGSLKGTLSTQGRDMGAFVRNLTGDFQMSASNGKVPVNMPALMAATIPLEDAGWSADASTAFNSLKAECHVGAGHVWCQRFSMNTASGMVSGSGNIDLAARSLDWNFALPLPPRIGQSPAVAEAAPKQVAIRGPLALPRISRLEPQQLRGENAFGAAPEKQPATPN